MSIIANVIDWLADARVPVLTKLARIITDADAKDARIWAALLPDDELTRASACLRNRVLLRAVRAERLRRGL